MKKSGEATGSHFALFIVAIVIFLGVLLFVARNHWQIKPSPPMKHSSVGRVS